MRVEFFRACRLRALIARDRASATWNAHVIIELDNLLVSAFREFLVASNRGARRLSGAWASTAVAPFPSDAHLAAQALAVVNNVKFQNMGAPAAIGRRDEHKFRNPIDVRKVLSAFGASNLQEFDVTLELGGAPFLASRGAAISIYPHT